MKSLNNLIDDFKNSLSGPHRYNTLTYYWCSESKTYLNAELGIGCWWLCYSMIRESNNINGSNHCLWLMGFDYSGNGRRTIGLFNFSEEATQNHVVIRITKVENGTAYIYFQNYKNATEAKDWISLTAFRLT